ncbi:hypothetical protein Q4488_03350 [Amphritea sp. 1_MG-2023]|uniref:hypothetical protein n=1 Tax=Amphritea sp. 1_MG-2023 TaxID=3062670 RepID=UPI0026E3512E|nr:hypothetical protein [Amphritea sp. 1_MG-2023]MDO6562411.1 hypothetical protein [Amphritea sp. 1_MG-2023]
MSASRRRLFLELNGVSRMKPMQKRVCKIFLSAVCFLHRRRCYLKRKVNDWIRESEAVDRHLLK